MLLQSDLAGERSQFVTENKTAITMLTITDPTTTAPAEAIVAAK
ncbi:hypothetical protein Tco_1251428, partial [Tanacetum coccineum]